MPNRPSLDDFDRDNANSGPRITQAQIDFILKLANRAGLFDSELNSLIEKELETKILRDWERELTVSQGSKVIDRLKDEAAW